MQVDGFLINITSESPERMIAFYRDVLKLPQNKDMGEGGFNVGANAFLVIDGHSETQGHAKEPSRFLVDFTVKDLAAEKARLEQEGVTFIREPAREYWGGLITTFLDPDGNYLQLFETPHE